MSMQPCCPPSGLAHGDFEEPAALFKAIADPHRLAMLASLTRAEDELCVCDFTAGLPLNQPTVSHHLKILRDAGLVTCERRGTWVYYRIASEAQQRLHDAFTLAFPQKAPGMKTHLNLATADLDKSIAFYRTLLNSEPAKEVRRLRALRHRESRPGIGARFESPALNRRTERTSAWSSIRLKQLRPRLHDYNRQDSKRWSSAKRRVATRIKPKVWATDPDGRRWEIYTVHEEMEERDNADAACCATDAEHECCAS